jgi:hypothetical protein
VAGVKGRSGRKKENPFTRFWAKVEKGPGCWAWTASRDKDGYGQFWFREKMRKAHVASFLMHVGEVPDGTQVCHTCDNPWCVRPEHLFAGTHQDNVNDKVTKGRQARFLGEKNPAAVLTETDVRGIKQLLAAGNETLAAIGSKYGIAAPHVHHIKSGKLWAHVREIN